jgi:uncharacterized protein
MQGVINAVKQAGVKSDDIQTQTVNLQPQYNNQPNSAAGTNQLTGYLATNTVVVTVRNLDSLGALLDSAVQAGGNNIQSVSFQVSNPAQQLDQAREAAFNDAKHKATQLAQLAGATLGPVYSISETSSQPPQPLAARSFSAESGAAVPVQPGTQNVEVDLNVVWLLE